MAGFLFCFVFFFEEENEKFFHLANDFYRGTFIKISLRDRGANKPKEMGKLLFVHLQFKLTCSI